MRVSATDETASIVKTVALTAAPIYLRQSRNFNRLAL
jgi:hypothetical protein